MARPRADREPQSLCVGTTAYDLSLAHDEPAIADHDERAVRLQCRASMDAALARADEHGAQLSMFWLALALCHTVIVESDLKRVVQQRREQDAHPATTLAELNARDEWHSVDSSRSSCAGAGSTDAESDDTDDDAGTTPLKYQAASPDELALVSAARDAGYELRERRPVRARRPLLRCRG